MMSTRTDLILRKFYEHSIWSCRFCSSVSKESASANPGKLFFNNYVQRLLRSLTRVDEEKVFQTRKEGKRLKAPIIKFMTVEELEQAKRKANREMNLRLQMPPVIKMNDDEVKVLAEDHLLQGYSPSKYVFTDISAGVTNKDRIIVVREPKGTLRFAKQSERGRINQSYFPIEGKEIDTPKMFYDPYLADLIEREEFNFILDRACIQFDPDEPDYHRVTKQVYNVVNSKKKYDTLRSTRHFGPLVFHLTWEKQIDDLLTDVIQSGRLDEAVSLIKLYNVIHPTANLAEFVEYDDDIKLIQNYAKYVSSKRHNIEHALSYYKKLQEEKQELDNTIKAAHGKHVTEENLQDKTE
ncbi:mitochondrial ribosomal protein S22 isoform X2 [Nomia melanderi]|uniref:mitochondrial ribosomal protein S22 isoform X2 n=1 Tax=Nomia melanderi TaxID=2448451 RepID=UPI0013044E95|nr:28S ribosomal protein S22, mitochondrial isoform X2 [Nomia melanderi]